MSLISIREWLFLTTVSEVGLTVIIYLSLSYSPQLTSSWAPHWFQRPRLLLGIPLFLPIATRG